ncbi:cysteine-rich receptor-like protein kinase 43 isoform X2 [Magnolia sinica]|uniref:cysteine-rich receptor-like protein kinase 43 isoform X2 n=1 Tax=Magnolia sinica TaxID=86752 RepID=UPI002658DDBE|nr:cysteine-rich receptor-like protein kinase 43 isoform X2 [Magnolia sinica]
MTTSSSSLVLDFSFFHTTNSNSFESDSATMRIKISHFIYLSFSFIFLFFCDPIASDPQAKLLNKGCSSYNVTSLSAFISNLNSTLAELRSQLNSTTRFATAQRPGTVDPVYALFQCRDYLSTADCVSCFDTAQSEIQKCSAANGARVIYDGCFLRYEGNGFFDQTTLPGNRALCGNETAASVNETAASGNKTTVLGSDGFRDAVNGLLTDITTAAPRMEGYFAAARRGGAGGAIVYGVAQCAPRVSEEGCEQCLKVAYGNIERCMPDVDGRAVDAGCFLRYSDTAFFSDDQVTDLAPFLRTGDILGVTELQGPVNYHYNDLKSATKNFSEENKLGEGGFGDVYKGVLKNGKIVAVKKLMIRQSKRAREDFESEVKLISNVHHRNLVRLLGCCSKGSELLLVYEFMANSSLDKYLFGNRRGSLNWKQRFDIIIGVARGLAYLHEEFHVCIIHRDIKPGNILLDDNFQARIADFGLARLLPEDQSHLSTKFAGTLGYTAPEYAIHGQLSEKVDTYSYGVVVLEIISGRKSNDTKLEPVAQYLLEWAWKLYETDSLMKLVDESLDPNEYEKEEVKRVIEIALMCTQSTVASRPTISEVVVMLRSKGDHGLNPTHPTFIDAASRVQVKVDGADASTSTISSTSNATMSISQYSGR